MNNKLQYFILTKITPTIISAIVMILVFNGVGMGYIEGADGKLSKVTDDDFCRVSAFNTDDKATAEERSQWCSDADQMIEDTMIFGFIIVSIIGMILARSLIKPIEEWEINKSAI